ncbi:Aminopeptidase N [Trichinella pseudospiralis]|uniref:Aminopeptidase N n=1 Tax=Trichinella pseudospiralis TaxID=6337 RepID=A0A0V0YPN7_TRIPS|nr:Aminopeptidase N [Trichinella pseudospiralis]
MEQEVIKSRPTSKSRRLITTITVTVVVIVLLCVLVGLVIYFMSKTLRQPMPANARLPKSVKPLEYTLKVQVYYPNSATTSPSDKLFTFDGNLTVEIECISSTKNITMNLEEINIVASSLKLIEKNTKKKIEFSNPAFEVESVAQMVTFYPVSELEPNKRYFLSMSYTGKLADDLQGFYRANYTFEPTDARRALPCFDEPEFKSVFTLTVIHPANTTALSNMPAVYTKIIRDAWIETSFQPSVQMSSYLFAIAVVDFPYQESYESNERVDNLSTIIMLKRFIKILL